ncbi:MAG: amino acid synthesis family protein [Candidatus Symbiobacter sp.]|nr:amino acid synthesis family protein [Candidatus Symbiobacter sp.]
MIDIRRRLTSIEDIFHEFGPPPPVPLRRGAIAAVLRNPFAKRYEANLMDYMAELNGLGLSLARQLLAEMRLAPDAITSYGKGALIGGGGELEHGAVWHVPGGYAMRELLGWTGDRAAYLQGTASQVTTGQPGNALAIVPSTKKVAPAGASLDIPLTHINASYVRSHFDAFEMRVPGSPQSDEIVFMLAMSNGARIHARVGGLKPEDISQWNGLR